MSREWDCIRKQAMEAKLKLDEVAQLSSNNAAVLDTHLRQISDESGRVANIYHNPRPIIDDIDEQFKRATKLTDLDVAFLFVDK